MNHPLSSICKGSTYLFDILRLVSRLVHHLLRSIQASPGQFLLRIYISFSGFSWDLKLDTSTGDPYFYPFCKTKQNKKSDNLPLSLLVDTSYGEQVLNC